VTRATTTVKTQEIAPIFSLSQTEKTQIPGIYLIIPMKPVITSVHVRSITLVKTATYSSLAQLNPVKTLEIAQTSATILISLALAHQRTPTKPVRHTFLVVRRLVTTTERARTRRISLTTLAVVRGITPGKIASTSFHAV
jgi:hypothetical protein